jgi:hypothetical protein
MNIEGEKKEGLRLVSLGALKSSVATTIPGFGGGWAEKDDATQNVESS